MGRPVAIEVRNLEKSFRVRGRRLPPTIRARLARPTGWAPARRLQVLRGLSFDVHRGEFFGVVGRNGCGKSTLLKIIASVYGADRGRVRIAGRLAPFLELGVGFNVELTALDNIVLNGVMMGLSPREARRRYDEVIEFAGLEDYADLQVKNYSSGMKVRLGFAVMTHVDADILLIDEVLAVGDAEFQEKCGDVFERMHREGRTMILVTHSMPTVIAYCERALLLDDGKIDTIGPPDEVSERYYEVNLRAALERPDHGVSELSTRIFEAISDPAARVLDSWLVDERGERIEEIADGTPLDVRATIRVERELREPGLSIKIRAHDGQLVFVSERFDLVEGTAAAGELFQASARIENRLPAGRYTVACDLLSGPEEPAGPTKLLRFAVEGEPRDGVVKLDHDVRIDRAAEIEVSRR
jgi:ABC-2 type transport system ATP-binding protein